MSREKGITRHALGFVFMHVVVPKPLHTFGRHALVQGANPTASAPESETTLQSNDAPNLSCNLLPPVAFKWVQPRWGCVHERRVVCQVHNGFDRCRRRGSEYFQRAASDRSS